MPAVSWKVHSDKVTSCRHLRAGAGPGSMHQFTTSFLQTPPSLWHPRSLKLVQLHQHKLSESGWNLSPCILIFTLDRHAWRLCACVKTMWIPVLVPKRFSLILWRVLIAWDLGEIWVNRCLETSSPFNSIWRKGVGKQQTWSVGLGTMYCSCALKLPQHYQLTKQPCKKVKEKEKT